MSVVLCEKLNVVNLKMKKKISKGVIPKPTNMICSLRFLFIEKFISSAHRTELTDALRSPVQEFPPSKKLEAKFAQNHIQLKHAIHPCANIL